MNRLGILPAAGNGKRFNGLYKELLPCGTGETLLTRAVDSLEMIPVDSVLVVSNHYKINAHCAALAGRGVKFAIQRYHERDAWDAITESFDMAGDWNYYLMPDTWMTQGIIPEEPEKDFALGIFETFEPERFGVVMNGEIIDKSLTITGRQFAWGVVVWSKRVVDFWKRNAGAIMNHTDAFNMAMSAFGYSVFDIPKYLDIASFDDYKQLVANV